MRSGALVAILLLAGCAAPAPTLQPDDGPAALPWRISDCAFIIAAVPVDAATLAARLPEGFALSRGRLSALPAGPSATIELDAYACADGRWGNASFAPLSYGSYYAAVVPPADLREDGYDAYFVKWDFVVPDAATRSALAELPAHEGAAEVTIDGSSVQARLAFADDDGGFSFEGAFHQPPGAPGDPLPFMEFTLLAEGAGLARWHARLHDASIGQGAGVVTLPEGSWVRELVGAPQAPATFIAGTWNLDEADVAFPIEWP